MQSAEETVESHIVETIRVPNEEATSFQFDLSHQEATGHETDDASADEDSTPSLIEGEHCSDTDDESVTDEEQQPAEPKVPLLSSVQLLLAGSNNQKL